MTSRGQTGSRQDNRERSGDGGWFEEQEHVLPLRVYYEDTDAAGIVYYANYLKFAERGRTELMRCLGFEHRRIMAAAGIAFVVRNVNVSYGRPARLDDAIAVRTRVTAVGRASLQMTQLVTRRGDGEELVSLDVRLACIDAELRPGRLPPDIRTALAALVAS